MRYPRGYPDERPVEKGVDVELAVGAVESVLTDCADVAILFTHDSDLLPVPEMIARSIGEKCVETASWEETSRFRQRLRPKGDIYHHYISRSSFRRIATPINYAHKLRGR